eukprot:SAG22_NODE_4703_length_1187_cov_1.079963_2_plen_42_part_01
MDFTAADAGSSADGSSGGGGTPAALVSLSPVDWVVVVTHTFL